MALQNKFTKKGVLTIIGVLIAFIISAGGIHAAMTIQSVKDTVTLATTVKPETFTELYFVDHLDLARSTATESVQKFAFTIHNLEYKTMTYPYEVSIQDTDGNQSILAKESVTLKHDESKTIPVYYELLEKLKRAKVVVNFTEKDQKIHYWIGEENK